MQQIDNARNHLPVKNNTELDICFNELMSECRNARPSAMLSYGLRAKLERLPRSKRKEVVSRLKDGCAALFITCKRGHCEIAEYLLTKCGADIEQRGQYEVPDERSVHCVTPLWCAAVVGNLPIIQLLLKRGADINAVSDSGSTPVRSACFMTHIEIVKFLVENGADIKRANYNGGTCLINSVQSDVLCSFLLENGADVNARDIQNKTALHYAIQEHRIETTKLLLERGADVFAMSRYGDDALQTACIKGAHEIFTLLKSKFNYSQERIANAHELLGSTCLDEHNDTGVAIFHWSIAHRIRKAGDEYLPKLPVRAPREAFGYMQEFTTDQELENIATDIDAMRIQSLLICERILGPYHKDTVFRLMYRGASYADALRYQRCIDMWLVALQLRVEKDSILYSDTCFSAQAIVKLMLDLINRTDFHDFGNGQLKFSDIVGTFTLLTENILEARNLLEIRPVHKKQQESFDRMLKCITHLIYLLLMTASNNSEKEQVNMLVHHLMQHDIRSSCTGDSLLHLCVSRLNVIKSSYFAETNHNFIFPNLEVARLLLNCGANVNARNESKSTPLHIASITYNFDGNLVQMLLENGAHVDQPNKVGECPFEMIQKNSSNVIPLVNYLSLKCLASTIVCKHKIKYKGQIPKTLEAFVKYHEA
ncbi:protein fem-1 homolog CG6966 isoform X1 [Ctenocephalides felis]|uniref:protein fem-1 homolog CG6966 isoform X1 n=1 Tax=Ctenocephalides felis TaxID=7515 RepID=UPI000E6E28AE|nr:protein fem-1 homolog CG6966 isoform X1 [Ctenocephalides felis]